MEDKNKPMELSEKEKGERQESATKHLWDAQTQLNLASGNLYEMPDMGVYRNEIITLSEKVGELFKKLGEKLEER